MNTTPNENLENESVATVEPEAATTEESLPEETALETPTESASDTTQTNEASAETTDEVVQETTESLATENDEASDNPSVLCEEYAAGPCGCKEKKFAFAGLLALIAVCVALWVAYSGIFADKYAEIYDTSHMSAIYVVDDTVKGHKHNGKLYTLSDKVNDAALTGIATEDIAINTMLRSPDGGAVFYYENYDPETYTGDLFVNYSDTKGIAIDTGVSSGLLTSADGKVLTYAKVSENEEGNTAIALYLYKKNGTPKLLTENYTPSISPMMSYSAKYLAFVAPDAESGTNALYIAKTSGFSAEPVKVAENVNALYSVNDKGYAFFSQMTEGEDAKTNNHLCYAAPGKALVKVAPNASVRQDCFGQFSNKFAYYTHTEEGKAQFYVSSVGKTPDMLFENSDFYLNPDVENKKYIFITIDEADSNLLHIQRVNGKKNTMIAENTSANGLNNVLNSRDYNRITYIRNFNEETYSGEFFMSKTFLGMTKEIKIADDVSLAIGTPDLKYLAYFTNLDLNTGLGKLHLFDGKKSTMIAENVPYYSVSFSGDDKTLFYLSNCSDTYTTADLNMVKTASPKKSIVIDTEISTINTYEFLYTTRTNGSVYYFKNYDNATGIGDLYFAKKGKNPTLVENKVSGLVFE